MKTTSARAITSTYSTLRRSVVYAHILSEQAPSACYHPTQHMVHMRIQTPAVVEAIAASSHASSSSSSSSSSLSMCQTIAIMLHCAAEVLVIHIIIGVVLSSQSPKQGSPQTMLEQGLSVKESDPSTTSGDMQYSSQMLRWRVQLACRKADLRLLYSFILQQRLYELHRLYVRPRHRCARGPSAARCQRPHPSTCNAKKSLFPFFRSWLEFPLPSCAWVIPA